MKNRRWSGNDRHFWPFTWSRDTYRKLGIMLDSGAHEDMPGGCHIRIYLGTWTLICELPRIITDYVVRHKATTWDAETVARIGRDWYDERFPREYGFSWSFDGAVHAHYGPMTHDSRTTKSAVFNLPWSNCKFIRHSLYDLEGKHFHTEFDRARSSWQATIAVEEACPKMRFEFDDYDGQRITATTCIEEREWRRGTGVCVWRSWFTGPEIERSLKLEFSKEVGPEKGSWKGGTTGHSIRMLPGELHEAAFKRYCGQEHRSKYRRFQITFVGKAA